MSGIWREDDDEPYRVGGRSSGSGGGGAAGMRSKPRFTFTEVKLLLDEVKRNRYILLKRFNNGVSAEAKKQTWAEITELINDLGENHREVRQIMKKWADLKCDGKRRIAALRGTNSSTLKKKTLGPVERMVHKILLMAPGSDTNNSDLEWDDDDEMDLKKWQLAKGVPPPPTPAFSYLSTGDNNSLILPGGSSFDVSPLSTPEKEPSEFDMIEDDFDDDDKELDAVFSRLPSSGGGGGGASSSSASSSLPPLDPLFSSSPGGGEALLKFKPRHTYSRSIMPSSNPSSLPRPLPGPGPPPQPSIPVSAFLPLLTSDSSASSSLAPMTTGTPSSGREEAPPPPASSSSFATNGTTFHPGASLMSSSVVFPPNPSSSSVFPPSSSSSTSAVFPPPPLPHPSYSQQPPHHLPPHHLPPHLLHPPSSAPPPRGPQLSALAAQSLQQQHASRLLLSQVSHSLGTLAQSVQLLVESQQEFVQESLTMQRETVDILRDFSGTVLAMLGSAGGGGGKPGEKSGSGGAAAGGGSGPAHRPV